MSANLKIMASEHSKKDAELAAFWAGIQAAERENGNLLMATAAQMNAAFYAKESRGFCQLAMLHDAR